MIEALVFPDTRACLFDLIDGHVHQGDTVRAFYFLPPDAYSSGPYPAALIYVSGGDQGYVDRVDRATVEVYAPGEQAVRTLESIRASIVGTDIETPSGYLDEIKVQTVPVDVPFYSETLNKAQASFEVISRPV